MLGFKRVAIAQRWRGSGDIRVEVVDCAGAGRVH